MNPDKQGAPPHLKVAEAAEQRRQVQQTEFRRLITSALVQQLILPGIGPAAEAIIKVLGRKGVTDLRPAYTVLNLAQAIMRDGDLDDPQMSDALQFFEELQQQAKVERESDANWSEPPSASAS